MNQHEFNKMYNTAINKIAVGFYILDSCGKQLGYDEETIQTNKEQLCGILSQGVNVSVTSIYSDTCKVYRHLDTGYINQLRASGLLEDLVESMQSTLAEENNQQLGYNLLDN